MKKLIGILILGILPVLPAQATEITPANLVGRYKATAKVAFKRYNVNLRVLNTRDFEITRVYDDGRQDETCNGQYSLDPSLYWAQQGLTSEKNFRGLVSCPSDRSKQVKFNIAFGDKSMEDLEKGTNVTLTTSKVPGMRLNTFVKRQ